jgi:hypothetical protein
MSSSVGRGRLGAGLAAARDDPAIVGAGLDPAGAAASPYSNARTCAIGSVRVTLSSSVILISSAELETRVPVTLLPSRICTVADRGAPSSAARCSPRPLTEEAQGLSHASFASSAFIGS